VTKPVAPRVAAQRDAEQIVADYVEQAGVDVALRFVDALEDAYRLIGENPGAGSPRYGLTLDLPGLRSWRVRGFPHLIFYIERADVLDVWRILHGSRDVPTTLADAHGTDENR
jgi:toxin ParE1/3/4